MIDWGLFLCSIQNSRLNSYLQVPLTALICFGHCWIEQRKLSRIRTRFQASATDHRDTVLLELNKSVEKWTLTLPEPWKNLVSPTGGEESAKAYQSFQVYLNLGIHRTIRKAVSASCNGQYDHSVFVSYVERSKKLQWE